MILLVDNYDSFTFNLQRYLIRLGQSVTVIRNDSADLNGALEQCRAIVLSPGPKAPSDAGRCLEIVSRFSGQIPMLGICLGHQVIYQAFGGSIVRAKQPVHGRDLPIELLNSSPLLDGIEQHSRFARYHSLIADSINVPKCLQVIARSLDSEIMAIAHRQHATYGVQFHPESILSQDGYRLLANFLKLAGLPFEDGLPSTDLGPSAHFAYSDLEEAEHPVVLPARPLARKIEAPSAVNSPTPEELVR